MEAQCITCQTTFSIESKSKTKQHFNHPDARPFVTIWEATNLSSLDEIISTDFGSPRRPMHDSVFGKTNQFCSLPCTEKYIVQFKERYSSTYSMEQQNSVGALLFEYVLPINILECCTFCGNFTHPTEHCAIHGYRDNEWNYYDENFKLYGSQVVANGCLYRLFLPNFVSLSMGVEQITATMAQLNSNFQERLWLATTWDKKDQATEYINTHLKTGEELTHTKHYFWNFSLTNLYSSIPPDDWLFREHVFHVVQSTYNHAKLFFPFTLFSEQERLQMKDNTEEPVLQNTYYPIHEEIRVGTLRWKDFPIPIEQDEDVNWLFSEYNLQHENTDDNSTEILENALEQIAKK